MTARASLLLALVALVSALSAEPRHIELGYPQLKERVEVYFPENHDPARKWPAIFYYHGTNGTPDTRLIRHHTREQNWFVVAMGYVQRGKFTYTKETLADELQILHSTRHHLASKHNLDPKRVYVAGFSKGGWMADLMLQSDRTLAGAVILGAGHLHESSSNPSRLPGSTAVFVGVGREDGNYPFGLRAITFYRGLGASTTFETWDGLGHAFPQSGSQALTQWLAIQGDPDADHKAAAREWVATRLPEIDAIPDPANRWAALRAAEATPYATIDAPTKAMISAKRTALERTAVVSREAGLLASHRKLLLTEVKDPGREDYLKLATAYKQIHANNPTTRQGTIAKADYERVTQLLKHFEEQDKIRKEDKEPFGQPGKDNPFDPGKAPDPRPRIPGNPLVR
jgi:predicted esterase